MPPTMRERCCAKACARGRAAARTQALHRVIWSAACVSSCMQQRRQRGRARSTKALQLGTCAGLRASQRVGSPGQRWRCMPLLSLCRAWGSSRHTPCSSAAPAPPACISRASGHARASSALQHAAVALAVHHAAAEALQAEQTRKNSSMQIACKTVVLSAVHAP